MNADRRQTPSYAVVAFLSRASLTLMAPLSVLCLALFAHHRSTTPVALGWSWRYLLLAMVPFCGLLAVQFAALVIRDRLMEQAARGPVRAWGILGGFVILGATWTTQVPGPIESFIAAFWVLSLVNVGGTICAGRAEGLLAQIALTLSGLVLLSPEASHLLEPRRERPLGAPSWGDDRTFAYTFPREPPYIGAGGRLRPGISLLMTRSSVDQIRKVRLATNRLGFRNADEPGGPADRDALTVLNLGDSFGTGYGIDQDEFVGPLVQKTLEHQLSRRVRVWNAEVSDPCYGAYYLQQHAATVKPRVVMFGLAGNDILQGLIGCGPKGALRLGEGGRIAGVDNPPPRTRFEEWNQYAYQVEGDRTVMRETSPPLLPTFADGLRQLRLLTWVARRLFPERGETSLRPELTGSGGALSQVGERKLLFDGFPNLGFAYLRELPPARDSYAVSLPLLEAMARNTESIGARFVLVYFPQRHQVQPQDWDALKQRWQLNEADFDLDLEQKRLRVFCNEKGIEMIDLTPSFRSGARNRNLYLPWDGHPSEAGHRLAAEVIAPAIESLLRSNPRTAPPSHPASAR